MATVDANGIVTFPPQDYHFRDASNADRTLAMTPYEAGEAWLLMHRFYGNRTGTYFTVCSSNDPTVTNPDCHPAGVGSYEVALIVLTRIRAPGYVRAPRAGLEGDYAARGGVL